MQGTIGRSVRNLRNYLLRFPDAPRKAGVIAPWWSPASNSKIRSARWSMRKGSWPFVLTILK